ncbi:protein of unknown function, DUF1349 [Moorena producens 3L]|uniref:FG-GAP repeat protein n=1 Tax=Moorena producens 3L TaxID=489825 RepID=F4XRC6_9CYAN|nr:protein of unknown function, DUF1349 [Moorena producens 3L]OLT55768.1 hypothetical protein BI334_32710 [Moorena producens 3L]
MVLDTFVNDYTIGMEIKPEADVLGDRSHVDLIHAALSDGSLQSVQPAGDLNGDGLGDAYIITVNYEDIAGERKQVLQRVRHTYLGTVDSLELVPDERLVLATSVPFETNHRPPWSGWPEDWLPAFLARGGIFPIGDVDGDGFEDHVVGTPGDVSGTGTATVLFGPADKENFVVFNGDMQDIGLPTNPGRFGDFAGRLGDLNGDGFEDFFIGYWGHGEYLYIFHGRDFGRDLPADIDRNGTVDFADFLVLAYNYGNENVTRSEGDLDGDGLVAFSDFIVLRDTFGQSKGNVPHANG